MNLESGSDDESQETCIEDEDYDIGSVFEQERCGICIDIVIDRGVLDCCDHWFCFACVDNWASITNFCPICKNEFQLITCLPVYDTIRSITSEEHPLSRNENWSIQGKNKTLSFPSYYISEDAVKCLEHDGCKIRMLQGTEDLSFDTSIACDSCDIWYHAFCVGFNPQFTSENSWLCPRCTNNEVLQKSGAVSLQNPAKYSALQTTESGRTIDPSLSGKVSVSVADTGETAVVISMIAEKQKTDHAMPLFDSLDSNVDLDITKFPSSFDNETSETALLPEERNCMQVSEDNLIYRENKEHCTSAVNIDKSELFFDLLPEIIDFKPYGDLKEATVSPFSYDATIEPRNDITQLQSPPTLRGVPLSLCYSVADDEGKDINSLETRSDSVYSDGYMDTSFVALCTSETNEELDNKCGDNIVTCLAAAATTSDNAVTSSNEEMLVDICQKSKEGCKSTAEPGTNKARKINMDENNDCIRKREQEEDVFTAKKPKLDRKFRTLCTGNKSNSYFLNSTPVCLRKMKGATLPCARQEEAEADNIMSIVQESDCKSDVMLTEIKAARNLIDKKDSACGLRVKKIMRRVGEKRESSILAEELGKEIREVVQKKTLKDIGKNDFDEKLLAAFRAAMVRPQNDLARSHSVLVAKKRLPVNGKKREKLTKKIYGTSSGRRRHAWARDCEIEFWKHRCRSAQYEKVETLQSVLELLKKATNPNWNSYMGSNSQEESTDSILSRVYVADASVFPRKDDIKPLSAASGSCHLDNHNLDEKKSLTDAVKGALGDNKSTTKSPIQISKSSLQFKSSSCDSIDKSIHSAGFFGEILRRKVNSGKVAPETVQNSGSNCSKESTEEHSYPSDAKNDKRKWALEVLATKTASANMIVNKGQDNGDLLKGKYPLLAQLPQDMRPILASTQHNKVSASVRQAQLFCITEHYLRRANLPVIRRTAETELAVADAVNIEKEILERSSSKLVYVNLCSQAVSKIREATGAIICSSPVATNEADQSTKHDTEIDNKPESVEMNVSGTTLPISLISSDVSRDRNSDSEVHGWSNVEEALKLSGLFSDSPPGGAYCSTKDSNQDECAQINVDEILNFVEQPEPAVTNVSSSTLLTSEISNEISGETNAESKACGWSNVEEALKMAGLFSLSPPSSPYCASKVSNEDKSAEENLNEILNCDAHHNIQHSMDTDRNDLTTQSPGKAVYNCIDMAVELPFSFSKSFDQQKECRPENCNLEVSVDICLQTEVPEMGISNDISLEECEWRNEVPRISQISKKPLVTGEEKILISSFKEGRVSVIETNNFISDPVVGSTHVDKISGGEENLETQTTEKLQINPDIMVSISNKVEAYIKEHVRPLCKSGVITVEQYRWAVGKTLVKVMKFHHRAKNANFLIREGENVKKLAEKYVEAAQKQRTEVDKISR